MSEVALLNPQKQSDALDKMVQAAELRLSTHLGYLTTIRAEDYAQYIGMYETVQCFRTIVEELKDVRDRALNI